MAFNALTDAQVGQILRAARWNSEVRDNIRYLKGQAGTVVIENSVNFGAASPGASTRLGIGVNGSGARTSYWDLAGDDTYGDGFRGVRDADGKSRLVHRGTANFEFQTIESAPIWFRTAAALRGGWSAAGNWAVGNTAPQGRLHVTGPNGGGSMFWDVTGLTGSASILSSGTVTGALTAVCAVKASANIGSTGSSIATSAAFVIGPGVNYNIVNSGSDQLQIQCLGGGDVYLARTSGALSYKVSLWLVWN